MLNLIRRILQEEAEMKEMGMRINKLKQLQPSNYLLQSLKQKQSRSVISKREKAKSDAEQINSLMPELTQSLKNLSWDEINMELYPNGHYYLKLPKHILELYKLITKLYKRIPSEYQRLIDNVERVKRIYLDWDLTLSNEDVNMYLEKNRNRTHFPEGLPQSLLGYNLGYKMYRKLIDDLWFIQSQENASKEVQGIYRQLLQQTDLNCVVTKNTILIMRRDLTKEDKIKILSEYIFQCYEFSDRDFLKIQKDIILDGPLLRELGERRVQALNTKIAEYSQNYTRRAFDNSPFDVDYTYDENELKQYGSKNRKDDSEDDSEEDNDGECIPCSHCEGEGQTECEYCFGEGQFECEDCEGSGNDDEGNQCGGCDGSGYVDCEDCDGRGYDDCRYCDSSGCANN
jgi:hypothetical protein